MNNKREKNVYDFVDGTKFLKVQVAYEREFHNEKLIVINSEGEKEERILNGIIYEADAFGITGGVYTVYFANENFVTPYLVVDQLNNQDVTQQIKIHSQSLSHPAKVFSNGTAPLNINCTEENSIAELFKAKETEERE